MNFNRLFIYLFLFFAFQNTHVNAQTRPDNSLPGARTWGELVSDLNCTLPIDYDITQFTIRKSAWTADFDAVTFSTPVVGDFLTTNDKTEVLILSKPTNQDRTGVPEKNWTAVAAPLNKLYITRNILVYTYDNDGAGGLVLKKTIQTPDLNYEGPSPFLIAKVRGYPKPLVIVATSSASEKYPSRLIAYDEDSKDIDDFRWISNSPSGGQYGANVPGINLIHEQKDASGATVLVPHNDLKFRSGSSPGIANFDLNNPNQYPGVYVYNEIFSLDPAKNLNNKVFDGGQFGQGISTITAGGVNDGDRNSSFGGAMAVTVAADVIPGNGMLELVCGNTVYKINPDFSLNKAIPLNINGVPAPDGFTSIANIDQTNGRLDIVVTTGRSALTQSRLVYVWTVGGGDNAQLIATREIGDAPGWPANFHKTARNTGLAFIGDIDGNGQSEIGVASPYKLSMLSYNQGTGTLNEKWAIPTDDESGHTLITMFDFDQDGTQELVYRQERALKILGENGQDIKSIELWGSTAGDGAVVADLNGDGEADIIVTDTKDNITYFSNNQYPEKPDAKLVVFKSVLGTPWAPARSVWNQYAYFSFNVNDDLTIPIPQQNHGLEIGSFFPAYDPVTGCLTAATRPFNSFLVQRTLYTEGGCFSSGIPIMDAKVELLTAKFLCLNAGSNEIEVELKISNPGDADLPAEVRIQFSLGTTLIDNVAVGQTVPPGGSFTKTIIINSGTLGDNPVLPLFAIINPQVNGVYDFPECTYDGPVEIAVIPRPVFMVDQPEAICEGNPTGIFIKVTNSTDGSVDNAVVKWYKDAPNGTLITNGVIGGTTYTIDPDFSLQIDDLPAAATPYKFYLVDECSNRVEEVFVSVDPSPTIDFEVENVKCFGGDTGVITAILGDQPYISYSLDNGATFISSAQLLARTFSAGIYNVTVKASLNPPAACLADFQFIIKEPDLFEFSNPGQTEPLCAPTTGAISWNIQGGNPTTSFPFYTYTLNKNGTAVTGFVIEEINGKNVINGLDGGDYVLTATDSKECSISQNYALIAQEDPGFFLDDAAAICFGNDAVFEVDMTAPGVGIAVPSYEWGKVTGGVFTPIVTGQTIDGGVATIENDGKRLKITGLPASATEYSYQVRITGDNTCNQVPLDTKIKVNPLPDPEFDVVDISCFGGSDGSISLSNTLTGTFSFSLVGPSNATNTNGVFENLSAGSYTITVINTVTNCEITLEPIVVAQPEALALSNQALGQPSCGEENGSYSIDFQGGTAPFTLVLSLGGTPLETNPNFTGSSYSKTNLAPGTYSFTITDAEGCPITDSFNLTNDPKLPIGLVLDDVDICEGGIGTFQPQIDTGGNPRTVKWFYDALGAVPIAAGPDQAVAGVSYELVGENLLVTGIKNGEDRTYYVEISGDAYCPILEPATIKASPPLSVTIDVPEAICFGEAVTVTVAASGGQGLFQYSLDNGTFQSSNIFPNTAVGTHTIAVRSENGCTYQEDIEVKGPTAPITLEQGTVIIGASCNQANGIIQNVNVIGGWGDFSFEWRRGSSTGTLVPGGINGAENLSADTYFLVVTDEKGCDAVFEFIVPQQPLPDLVLVDQVICEGADVLLTPTQTVSGASPTDLIWYKNAAGTILIQNGSDLDLPQVTYTIGGDNGLLIEDLPAGIYTYYLKVVCTDELKPVNVTVNAAPNPVLGKVDILCFGDQSGKIKVTDNTNPDFRYSMAGFPAPVTQAVLEAMDFNAGTYQIVITEVGTDCSSTREIEIEAPTAPITLEDNVIIIGATCGQANGIIQNVNVIGGWGDFTFEWRKGSSTGDEVPGTLNGAENLSPGLHYLIVTDEKGCEEIFAFDVPEQPFPDLVLVPLVICEGDDAEFNPTQTVSGASQTALVWYKDPAGTILIETGPDSAMPLVNYTVDGESLVIKGLPAGIYTYYLQIVCSGEMKPVTVTVNAAPNPVLTNVDILCFGDISGKIKVTADANPDFRYSIDNGAALTQVELEAMNFNVGIYNVVITQLGTDCSSSQEVEIVQPEVIVFTPLDKTDPACGSNDGIIKFSVSGGTPAYVIKINNELITDYTYTEVGGVYTVTGLALGSYDIVITDANGCELIAPEPFVLADGAVSVVSPNISATICIGDQAVLTPNLTIAGGATPIINWFKDAALTQPIVDNYVAGGTGQMFDINTTTGEVTVFNLPVGNFTYYLEVSGPEICTISSKAEVEVTAAPNVVLDKVDVLCFGENTGKITLVSGSDPDLVYSINGAAPISQTELLALELVAGIYVIDFGFAGSTCIGTQTLIIEEPSEIALTVVGSSAPACGESDGTISFSVSGGLPPYVITINNDLLSTFTYTEVGGVYTVTGLALGNYEVEVIDENDCDVPPSLFSLVDNNINSVQSNNLDIVICVDESAVLLPELTISGGATTIVKWFKDAALTDLIVDNYVASGTGQMFGINTTSGELTVYNLPVGNYTYYLEVSGPDICTVSSKADVEVTAAPNVVLGKVDILCFEDESGKITVVSGADPNLEYSINGATPISQAELLALELGAGTYVVDFNYVGSTCGGTQTLVIAEPTEIELSVVGSTVPACGVADGTISFSVSGGVPAYAITINNQPLSTFTSSLINGVYTVTGLTLGSYDVVVTDANGCVINSPAAFVLADGAVSVVSPNLSTTICIGDQAVLTPNLTVSGGAAPVINWFRDAALTEPIVDNYLVGGTGEMFGINTTTGELTVYNLPVGNYTYYLEVSGPEICTVSSKADVEVTSALNVVLDKVDVLCFGDVTGKITLVSGSNPNLEYSINGAAPISQTALLALELAAGTYVIDFNFIGSTCGGTQTLVIAEPTEIELSVVGSTVPACGVADGMISFSVSGGVPAYAITINNQPLSTFTSSVSNGVYTVTGLILGSYDLVVTDANGCVLNSPAAFVLADGAVSVVSPNLSDTICIGDQAVLTPDLTISGGVVPTIKWFSDAALANEIIPNYVATGTGTMFAIDAATGALTVYNLPLGNQTYYLEVSGTDICTVSSRADVEVTAAPNVVFDKVDVLCYGDLTGKITVVSGADPNLEYSVNGAAPISQTALLALELAAGTYVIDFNYVGSTCGGTQTLIIAEPTEIELAIVGSTVPACGVADGTISFSVTGGVPAYAITINNQPLSTFTSSVSNGVYTVTGLILGSYDIVVTDANGCVLNSPAAFVLADGAVSVVSPNLSDTICIGDQAVLTPDLTISGGVVPTIKWFSDAALANEIIPNYVATGTGTMFAIDAATGALTVYNLPLGKQTYYLEVSGTDICTVSSRADVEVTAAPNVVFDKVDVLCYGDLTGKITVVSGADPNLEYSINGATPISQTALLALELAAGTYVIDFNYVGSTCGGTQTLIIAEPTEIELAIVGSTVPACGVADGTISFSVSGGVPAYSIKINNQPLATYTSSLSNGVYTVTGLALGSYDVVVTDANGCVLSTPSAFVLSDGNPVSVVSPNLSITICEGDQAVLTPNLTISGGVVPTIKWFSDAALTNEITPNYVATGTGTMFGIEAGTGTLTVYNLPLGDHTYYLEVSDPLICTANSRADVKVTAAPNPVLGKVDVLCFGEDSGKITLVSGADPNLEYSINGAAAISQTELQNMKFAAGTYVIDFNYVGSTCGGTQTLVIDEPTEIQLSIVGSTVPACGVADGTISFSISGGVPAYAITINNQPLSTFTSSVINGVYTVTGLVLGSYDIVVTDANGCVLNSPAAFVLADGAVSVVSPNLSTTICIGDQAVLTPDLTISGGATPILNWFRDAALTQPIVDNYVAGGTGQMFGINTTTGELTVYNLPLGNHAYYLEVSGTDICTVSSKADVEVTAAPNVVFDKVDVLCYGDLTGKITVVSGADSNLEYSINGATPISQTALLALELAAGTYVIDFNYVGSTCGGTQTLVIDEPVEIALTAVGTTVPACGDADGSISFSVSGGVPSYAITINNQPLATFTSSVSNGVYTVTGLTLGSYDIVVTDANGCVLSTPSAFVLSDGNPVSVISPNISVTICEGEQAVLTPNLTISGGVVPTIKWFSDAALTNEITSNYVSTGTGTMFAIDATTGALTVYNLPVADYVYYLEVSDPLICTANSRADVKVTGAPNPVLAKVDILCFGDITGEILLVSGGDPNLEYSINGAPPISQTALQSMKFAAGTYVIDFNYVGSNCGGTQTLIIAQPDALEFDLLNKVDAICGEDIGSIQFSLIGGTKEYTITVNNQPISSYNPIRVGDSYTLENLAAGTYDIKILDANNCLLEESVTLSSTNLLAISATDMQDEVCEGSPAVFVPNINNQSGVNPTKRWFKDQNLTDEITSNYVAGGAGVMYQIDPTTGTLTVYNLAAGDFTFYLELTDFQICPIVAKAEVKVNPFPLSQFDVLDILCFGDQNGKISLVSAGNPDLRFTVNGGAHMTQAALEAMDFPAGIYTIETINIGAICPDVQIKEIKQPEALIFEAVSFLEPTCDESNGDVVFKVTGGKAPYTILINGQPLSAFSSAVDNDRYVIANLAPGIYDISITDDNGCFLDQPKAFELTNIVATPITADKMEAEVCEGTPIEFVPVFQSGGVDPKKRWFRDAALTQEILSNFASTGTGVMYEIDPVSGKLTVYNLPDGNYTYYLQLSDPQICTLVTTAEGIVNPGIDAQAIATNEVCFGESNGSILMDAVSGGSGVYEFSLDNATWQSGNLFDNLSSGTYTVYIRDLGGQAPCVLTIPNILIEGPTASISRNDDYILIPASCDLPNGSISNVQISGGWGNFTFEWRKGSATGTVVPGTLTGAENLFPDLYYLIVKDEKGCEEIFVFEIKEQDKPNFSAIVPMAICALDDMTLTVIQNVPGASATGFIWSKGPNQTDPILSGPDGTINGVAYEIREVLNTVHLDISGLPAGSYTYYFYSECTGQEIPISFEVVAIPEPVFGLLEISCFDADNGKIVVTSGDTSDLTYSVDGGSFISKGALEALNFGPGTYTLVAQNSQGCISLPQTLTLDQPDALEIDLLGSKNSACGSNDGFIKLSIKGGTPEYTLILTKDGVVVETITTSAAEYTFSNLEPGVYEVSLSDKNDCQVDLAGNITLLDGPTEILIDDKFLICEGESVTLEPSINPATANPVYTWYWNSPTAGNELSDQQQISGILFGINAAGDLTISGLQIGTDYKVWVKVSGQDICEGDLKEVLIQVVPIPVFTAVSADENCFGDGGTIQITQGPGQNNVGYSVNGGPFQSYPGNLITGLAPGNYTLASQNAGGCTFDLVQTFVIVGPSAALTLTNVQATDANCGATDGTLSGQINGGTPGYQIALLDAAGNVVIGPVLSADGSIDFTNLASGTYNLTVKDAQGCLVTEQSILIDESPKVILADDQVICEGEVAVIRPSLVPAEAGTVFNWYYDREMNNPVGESLTPDQFGATYQIAANGEISMSGLPSRPNPYTYYIMVDGVGNCLPEVKEVNVTVQPLPTLRVSNPSIVCDPNQTVNLTQFIEGFNPNVFDYIVTSPNGNTLRLEDLATVSGTGSYTVQSSFKGSNCWTPVDRILVIISDIQLIADFQYEIVIDGQVFTDYDLQTEDQINFKDISQGNVIVWNWDFGDGTSSNLQNPSHQYDAPGRYVIRLTTIDQFGCTSVIERVLEIFNDYLIRIPNAFTPDGMTNRFFKPKFRGIVTMKLYIFNTWGDLIYETDNLEDQGWDGTLNGQNTPNGNYVYKAIFTTRTNEVIERAGVFILIR